VSFQQMKPLGLRFMLYGFVRRCSPIPHIVRHPIEMPAGNFYNLAPCHIPCNVEIKFPTEEFGFKGHAVCPEIPRDDCRKVTLVSIVSLQTPSPEKDRRKTLTSPPTSTNFEDHIQRYIGEAKLVA
jgi:hypothetical protein